MTQTDPYASSRETTEGRVYSVTGNDWDSLVTEIGATKEERRSQQQLELQEPSRFWERKFRDISKRPGNYA